MAWKLSQIKQAMAKEKKDRGKQGFIWESGKTGNLDSYGCKIAGRIVSGTNNGKSSSHEKSSTVMFGPKLTRQVKVLKDEPLNLPKRDSATKDLIQKLRSGFAVDSLEADTKNTECSSAVHNCEKWILVATDRSSSEIMELQCDENGNLPLSTIRAMEPTAVGVYYVKWGRKRLMMAVDNVIRRPKVGWGDEVYYPYAGRFLPEMASKPEPPIQKSSKAVMSPHETSQTDNGGALLKGSFNEEESSQLFQQAVNEWRNSKHENTVPTPPPNEIRKTCDMSVHVVQCSPREFKISFSKTSTLSYMEHILLQKHRNSKVLTMAGKNFVEKLNSYLEPSSKEPEENVFTAEELEERERIRNLFTPELINTRQIDKFTRTEDNLCNDILIEEVSDDDYPPSCTEACVIDESPPLSPVLRNDASSVLIEEMDYTGGLKTAFTANVASDDQLVDNHNEAHHVKNQKSDQLFGKEQQQTPIQHGSKSAKTFSYAFRTPREEGRSKSAGIAKNKPNVPTSGSLIKLIGEIPLNPDAIYRRGLNNFFVSVNSKPAMAETLPSDAYALITSSSIATDSTLWNQTSSICGPGMLGGGDTIVSNSQNSVNGVFSQIPCDAEEREQEEKVLDDLEWELASRTGNITADGRISRIIDEWPEEELDIIEDPGLGSGLTTPDVDCVSLAGTFSSSSNKDKMNLDFQNMEQLIMADLTDEYGEADEDLLIADR